MDLKQASEAQFAEFLRTIPAGSLPTLFTDCQRHPRLLRVLLRTGYWPSGESLFKRAAYMEQVNLIQLYVDAGCATYERVHDSWCLHRAIQYGRASLARVLIPYSSPAEIDDGLRNTATYLEGSLTVPLLQAGADPLMMLEDGRLSLSAVHHLLQEAGWWAVRRLPLATLQHPILCCAWWPLRPEWGQPILTSALTPVLPPDLVGYVLRRT